MSANRWRKLECCLWQDEIFRKLSPIPPCGQGLFIKLLTGPQSGPIPGLTRAGRAALAEEFEWSLEDFDKVFQEASDLGLVEADWKCRLLYVPSAITANPPQSPNVITSWGSEWTVIPNGAIKTKAYEALKTACCNGGDKFSEAFAKTILKPNGTASQKPMPIQEQEQVVDSGIDSGFDSGVEKVSGGGVRGGTNSKNSKAALEVKTKQVKTKLPKTFFPKDEHYDLAKQLNLDCESECHSFINYVNAKRSDATADDWDEVFCTWLQERAHEKSSTRAS
jgi:hypothetical protein